MKFRENPGYPWSRSPCFLKLSISGDTTAHLIHLYPLWFFSLCSPNNTRFLQAKLHSSHLLSSSERGPSSNAWFYAGSLALYSTFLLLLCSNNSSSLLQTNLHSLHLMEAANDLNFWLASSGSTFFNCNFSS